MAGDLFDSLLTIVAKLDDAGIPYALVGGLAVAVHGAPRATTDIDLLIDPADADRAVQTARDAGFAFEARPQQFNDGMRLRRVTRIEGGETLTLDLMLADPPLRLRGSASKRSTDEGGNDTVRHHGSSTTGFCAHRSHLSAPAPRQDRHVTRRCHRSPP